MRIDLYNPPVYQYSGTHYKLNPPLGLPIMASVLAAAGHEVAVKDLEALQIDPDHLGLHFARRKRMPDAVGFTVTTHNARGVKECIGTLRKAQYGGYIVLGGPHITMLGKGNIDEMSSFGADAWVVGECEGNVGAIFENQQRGLIQGRAAPIENIPTPLWSHHDPSPIKYLGNLPKVGHPEGIAMWSRGCPHSCIFCANPVFSRQQIRFKPPERIWADMEALANLGVKGVFVYDDELVGQGERQNEWLEESCGKIESLGLTWKCQGRCSEKHINKRTLRAMYAAGCRAIMWGVESFCDDILANIQKGTTEPDIWHALRTAKEVGIGNWLFLMVGNYGETTKHLAQTQERLAKAQQEGLVQWRQVTVCTPMPGTELYARAKEEGWLIEPPEVGPQMNQVYNATAWISKRELRFWKAQLEAA